MAPVCRWLCLRLWYALLGVSWVQACRIGYDAEGHPGVLCEVGGKRYVITVREDKR